MSKDKSQLSDDDVRQIAQLMDSLEDSSMNYLQVELGDMKVTLGKGDVPDAGNAPPAAPSATLHPPSSDSAEPPEPVPEATPAGEEEGEVITAPMLGRYYAQSEPGAEPFVKVGDEVNAESTVALIEVMKLFTTVQADIGGVITEICVENDEIVEFGQVLFRVSPK